MLKDDITRYRRWPYGYKKKTYKFLVRALDRQIDMNIRDKNYAALQGKYIVAVVSHLSTNLLTWHAHSR